MVTGPQALLKSCPPDSVPPGKLAVNIILARRQFHHQIDVEWAFEASI